MGEIEVESRIIRMNFCIIKPKFGQKWTFLAYSHVIYRWKGILRHISVVGIFVSESEVESRIIKMNFCIIKPKFGEKWTYFVYGHVIYH